MVEKRTLTILILATLVWALIASGLSAYYYLEMNRFQRESDEKQQSLLEIAEGYRDALERQDSLLRDYNALLGEYYMQMEEDCSSLVEKYVKLLSSLSGNYTATINGFPELKEAYESLMNSAQNLKGQGNVTKGEFEPLLMEFNELLRVVTARTLEGLIGREIEIRVNLCIDYGNDTVTWYNVTIKPGASLFDLTQQVAKIEYNYYPTMKPGHVLIKTINGVTESFSEWKYWFWYYWDETANQWVLGQVGCDAWTLRDNGTYKWAYKV
ncbi:hypothetical protein KEJ24_02715 [Candidatus Bathyarchaeota archaeon]|nr:hypothetical protein [Candidatus Bathyarchaeota archaeon]